jgi:HAD superfamily hydrolase (TIGR01490 family)
VPRKPAHSADASRGGAGPVSRSLGGAHVLLTGSTGFLGQATLEKLLSSYPDVRVSLLIRARGGAPAGRRLETLLAKPVFRPWRERVGDEEFRRVVAERVGVIDGDVAGLGGGRGDAGRGGAGGAALPDDIDVVIHAASVVSFDPPIDEAFATNVSGAVSLYEALAASGADPHVVHVSTAYVAGVRKGVVPEESLGHSVDWRAELAGAQTARADVERDSRRPETLRRVSGRAQGEHGKAGPQSVVASAEEARRDWVNNRLVEYGRARARSLGWPDVYTFTKALGERAAEELWGSSHRLSIVRPAIVESSLRYPYPGWIDGFKMAEPLIIAFGRGILREFPGLPDSVMDIIPVDLVVNAMLAVAAQPPPPGAPGHFHVGSGARNPLTFREMYEHVREYFSRHPLPAGERGHHRVPSWRFPGGRQVELMLRTSERAASAAERALLRMPGSPRTQGWMSALHRQQVNLDFLRRYSDLYQAYTQAEVVYDDTRTRALDESLRPADPGTRTRAPDESLRAADPGTRTRALDESPLRPGPGHPADHGFDPCAIDWRHYLCEVHLPSVTALMRGGSRGARGTATSTVTSGTRPGNGPGDNGLPERADVAAVFDLEGTVVASNLVESYLWARLSAMPRSRWPGELADLARSLPRYLRAERRDRGDFVRAFLRRYEGAAEEQLRELVGDVLGDALLQRVMPQAARRIRRHRAAGHRTVLITGAIDVLVESLSGLFDEVIASRMHTRDGVLTGYLTAPPLVDEARAAWLRRYAPENGVDLSGSYAYGDSYSDRPLLELVGNPAAVNPDPALYVHAKQRHWPILNWGAHTRGAGDVLLDTVGGRRPRSEPEGFASRRRAGDTAGAGR